jgi:hypothetical protein
MLDSALTVLSDPRVTAAVVGSGLFGFLGGALLQRWSANRLFDHRLKLEKEYSLYADVWEKLFELRRDLGGMLQAEVSRDIAADRINAFQAVVRRNEPFMTTSIYNPAREIVRRAREILNNEDKVRAIDEAHPASVRGRSFADDQQHADTQIRLDDENETSFGEIERLYQVIFSAIRARVRLP